MLHHLEVHFLIYILFAMHVVWYGLASASLLYLRKQQRDRSRVFIGCFFLLLAFGSCVFIITALVRGDVNDFLSTILEPYPIILSYFFNVLPIAYLVEVLHPHWLTFKRVVLILSPWLVVSAVWVIYHGLHGFEYAAITHLTDVHQILLNIRQTDVWLRVLLLSFHVLYSLLIPFIPYSWKTCNMDASRVAWLRVLVITCLLGFVFGMGLRFDVIIVVYLVLLDILSISVFVIELRDRIPMPESLQEEEVVTKPELSMLALRLQQWLNQELWKNPDIQRNDVCRDLNTNRTYLSSAIQELGYTNFYDMLNLHRAQYVNKCLAQNPKAVVMDVLFQAGFRSRSTALRSFMQVYHCTPSDMMRHYKEQSAHS